METRKRKDGTEYKFPKQADHFLLHDAPKIASYFGERGITKPRELDVILPFPRVEQNYDASYMVWGRGVLLCQGDGEEVRYANPMRVTQDAKGTHVYNEAGPTLVVDAVAQCGFTWGDEEFVEGQVVECPGSRGRERGYPHCAACKMSAILKVTPYADEIFEFGYYQVNTGSWRNHQTIMGTLESLPPIVFEKRLRFVLRMVQEQTVYTDDKGKRQATDRWFLHLMPHPALLRALFGRQAQELATGEPAERPQLVAQVDYEAEGVAPPPYAEVQAEMVVEDADWEEPEDQPPIADPDPEEEVLDEVPVQTPAPKPRAPSGRPYDPDTLQRRVLTVAASKRSRGKATEAQVGLVWALVGQMWEEPAEQMPLLLHFLFGVDELEHLSAKAIGSLIDWLKDPGSEPRHALIDRRAVGEAAAAMKMLLKKQGQESLPGMEE